MGIFTREENELLKYDANAFYYFAAAMLTVTLVPWSCLLIRELRKPKPSPDDDLDVRGLAKETAILRRCAVASMEARRVATAEEGRSWRRRLGGGVWFQLLAVMMLWVCFVAVLWKLQGVPRELGGFDPYAILGIDSGADLRDIKKAYRAKSLQHHPDKDRNNPMAPFMFQQVSKAYASLTDESARRNYEKHGNPDGPTQMKVGVALHPIMLMKEYQLSVLSVFFLALFLVPALIICCCLRGDISANGVSGESQRRLRACIDEELRAEDCLGLLAASFEAQRVPGTDLTCLSESMIAHAPQPLDVGVWVKVTGEASSGPLRGVVRRCEEGKATCNVEVRKGEVKELPCESLIPLEPKISCPFSDPPIRRRCALLWAHLWRLHPQMTPAVKTELRMLLRRLQPVGRAATFIACQLDRARFDVVRGWILARRCVVQALDFNDSPLLQLPHVSTVPVGMPSLRQVLAGGAAELPASFDLTPAQRLDIDAFCRHAPQVELSCRIEVVDEDDIAEGDIATLTVTLLRTNLQEGESVGPVYAPYFPGAKFEEWWILLYDDRSRRLLVVDAILGTGRTEKSTIRFIVPRHGPYQMTVHAMCDSYAGLDTTCSISFNAKKKEEVSKEIFIHPEDMNIRTLFEEIMMGLEPPADDEEDSDSEEEVIAKASPGMAIAGIDGCADCGSADGVAKAGAEGGTDGCAEGGVDSGTESDGEDPGDFYKITSSDGANIYREPCEGDENRVGYIGCGAVVRGFAGGDRRPDGWVELAGSGGEVWIHASGGSDGPVVECLGGPLEQQLLTLVRTRVPHALLRRWMRHAAADVTVEDVLGVLDLDDDVRMRMDCEEMLRKRLGDDSYELLLDDAAEVAKQKQDRIIKATGIFASQNGILWHVTKAGLVWGLQPDGSRIRDRVRVTEDDKIQLGPFHLDEKRFCSCIHWVRQDDPTKEFVWARNRTLAARMKLSSGR